jgi:hypothetical protein
MIGVTSVSMYVCTFLPLHIGGGQHIGELGKVAVRRRGRLASLTAGAAAVVISLLLLMSSWIGSPWMLRGGVLSDDDLLQFARRSDQRAACLLSE